MFFISFLILVLILSGSAFVLLSDFVLDLFFKLFLILFFFVFLFLFYILFFILFLILFLILAWICFGFSFSFGFVLLIICFLLFENMSSLKRILLYVHVLGFTVILNLYFENVLLSVTDIEEFFKI